MARKTKNYLIALAVVIISGGLTFTLASMKKPAQRKIAKEEKILVPVMEVENTEINTVIPVIGKLTARERIAIFAEVSGVLENTNKDFLEGVSYKKGEVILRINSDEAYQQLIAKRSSMLNLVTQVLPDLKFDYPDSYQQWYQYLVDFDMNKSTQELPTPLNDQEKYFITGKGIYQTYYDIKSSETRLEKYTVRAPFDGIVASSNIKPGALVMNGQSLGEFFSPAVYDLETEVSQSDINFISLGDEVTLKDEFTDTEYTGKVSRISQNVDSRTQSVKVYVSVSDSNLKEGQYLNGDITTTFSTQAIKLPRKYIVNNHYVYTVKDSILHSTPIDIIRNNNSTSIVGGLENGTLVSTKTKNLHEGLKVSIN